MCSPWPALFKILIEASLTQASTWEPYNQPAFMSMERGFWKRRKIEKQLYLWLVPEGDAGRREVIHWRCHRAEDRQRGCMLLRLIEGRVSPGRKGGLQLHMGKGDINHSPTENTGITDALKNDNTSSSSHLNPLARGNSWPSTEEEIVFLVSYTLGDATKSFSPQSELWHKMALQSEGVEFKHHTLHLRVSSCQYAFSFLLC